MPRHRFFPRQTIAVDVRPGSDELLVDLLAVEPHGALRRGFDQRWEKWTHFETIIELERGCRRTIDHLHAEARAALTHAGDER